MTSTSVVNPLPPHHRAMQPARILQGTGRAVEEVTWSDEGKEYIRLWAKSAPIAVATWATTLPLGKSRQFVVETVALAWGSANPLSAAKWAVSIPDETERTLALAGISGEATRADSHKPLRHGRFLR